MDSQLRDSGVQLKIAEVQTIATDIAVEFRQLLSYVEARNDNPNFDFLQIKVNFETIATSIAMHLTTLLGAAQVADFLLRDKCQQLAKLLRTIIEDVRHELIASSPASSEAHAQQMQAPANLAARLPRNTTEAVNLIKTVLAAAAAAQGQPPSSSPLSPTPSITPAEAPVYRPLPTPNPSASSHRAFVQHNPSRGAPSPATARPLTLTRTNSSPNSLRDSARAMSLSSPSAIIHSPTPSLSSPTSPKAAIAPVTSPFFVLNASDPLNAGMHRSSSLPYHVATPSTGFNTSSPSRRVSQGPPKKVPTVAVALLVDGTISQPQPPSEHAMTLLIDKRKDPALAKLVRSVLDSISWVADVTLKSKMLAFFVGSAMGKVPVGDFDVCRNCANNFTQLREKYPNEPCPLGEITYGYARHRALLYKYLADSVSLPARIHTHASKLRAPASDAGPDAKEPPAQALAGVISVVEVYLDAEKKWRVVDLLKEVGDLYEEDSPQAQEYKQTSIAWEDEQPLFIPEEPRRFFSATIAPPISLEFSSAPPSSPSPSPSSPSSSAPSPAFPPSEPSGPEEPQKPNGEPIPPEPVPQVPGAKPGAKPRVRAGTTGLPARPQRHSMYGTNQSSSPSAPGKVGAKAMPPSTGRVLRLPVENAEIILNERIGKGTFGDVYRCKISGYTCAVKIVNIKSLSEAALKMMHNEIYFLETLHHENIIKFLGHEEIPKREIKIFMEFMPLTLAGIIQKRNTTSYHFNKKDIIKCAKGMAEALSYLHHRKIIHRDIKSSNVLLEIDTTLDRVAEVRLCDFGVSKATETAIAITFTGTNLWVAPEVFDVQFGAAASYDEKCDIWSFGMVLVEMVTLNPPYYGISTQEATQHIRNGTPPSLEANQNIEESISNLIYSCLKKVPSERPSANDILSIINQL
eukprot:Phypoly_transcript_02166.p1 GENE.Phypoly_transcript_02166~~Phypoly_transcript_02166.p1  ORF type:complete len:914 (+),score=232.60 Phypoly_transcript_02166:171-2912(+)